MNEAANSKAVCSNCVALTEESNIRRAAIKNVLSSLIDLLNDDRPTLTLKLLRWVASQEQSDSDNAQAVAYLASLDDHG